MRIIIILLCMIGFLFAEYTIPAGRTTDWSDAGCDLTFPVDVGTLTQLANYTNYNDGVADARSAISSGLSSAPIGLYLPAGTYRISGTISVPEGKVLYGAGSGVTIIKFDFSGNMAMSFSGGGYSFGTQSLISANVAQGDSIIKVPDGIGATLNVNGYFLIDQTADDSYPFDITPTSTTGSGGTPCTWCGLNSGAYPVGQICKIKSINTAASPDEIKIYQVINYPLYSTSYGARITEFNSICENTGMGGFTLEPNNVGSDNIGEMIQLYFTANCYVYDVESYYCANDKHYLMRWCYKTTIRNCYMHHASAYGGSDGYGIGLNQHCTSCLIDNNIFDTLHGFVYLEGGGTGNVISYNYSIHPMYNDGDRLSGSIVWHGGHPHMNLVEGNEFYQLGTDYYWGTSSHNTYFRNKVYGWDPDFSGQNSRAFGIDMYCWFNNIVGNIIGYPGETDVYTIEMPTNSSNCQSQDLVYNLGYRKPDSPTYCYSASGDTHLVRTTLRHQNWDVVTNDVVLNDNLSSALDDADADLPNSLYLDSAPSWWEEQGVGRPWPNSDAATGVFNDLPAKDRYESEDYEGGTDTTPPSCTVAAGQSGGNVTISITSISNDIDTLIYSAPDDSTDYIDTVFTSANISTSVPSGGDGWKYIYVWMRDDSSNVSHFGDNVDSVLISTQPVPPPPGFVRIRTIL